MGEVNNVYFWKTICMYTQFINIIMIYIEHCDSPNQTVVLKNFQINNLILREYTYPKTKERIQVMILFQEKAFI